MKFLKTLLLSSLLMSSQVYADCTVSVNDLFFGDIMIGAEPEFTTSGYIDITCLPEDLGKNMTLSIDKNYIASFDNSIFLPINFKINNVDVPVNWDYPISITDLNIQIPITSTLNKNNLPNGVSPGMYSSVIVISLKDNL